FRTANPATTIYARADEWPVARSDARIWRRGLPGRDRVRSRRPQRARHSEQKWGRPSVLLVLRLAGTELARQGSARSPVTGTDKARQPVCMEQGSVTTRPLERAPPPCPPPQAGRAGRGVTRLAGIRPRPRKDRHRSKHARNTAQSAIRKMAASGTAACL